MLASAALAYEIFHNAKAYWAQQVYPKYLNYAVRVQVQDGAQIRTESYQSAYDADTGRIWVYPFSDYEQQHPATGHGVAFCASADGCPHRPQPAPDQDFIGVPLLSPAYSFTLRDDTLPKTRPALSPSELVAQIRADFHDPAPQRVLDGAGPTTIAKVYSSPKQYAVSLLGEGEVAGAKCYHLGLEPLHSDGRYRLRELWIDERSYATLRARIAINFVTGPGTSIPWIVNFAQYGGATYVSSEIAQGPYRYAGRTYQHVTVSFDDLRLRSDPLPLDLVDFSAYLTLSEP